MRWAPDDIALTDEMERIYCFDEAAHFVTKWALGDDNIEILAREMLRERVAVRRLASVRFLIVSGIVTRDIARHVMELSLSTHRMPSAVMNDEGLWPLGLRDFQFLVKILRVIEQCGDVRLHNLDEIWPDRK